MTADNSQATTSSTKLASIKQVQKIKKVVNAANQLGLARHDLKFLRCNLCPPTVEFEKMFVIRNDGAQRLEMYDHLLNHHLSHF